MRIPCGWVASGRGLFRRFDHSSGWSVSHCGHPTANYPWACIDPTGAIHTSGVACDRGYAFRLVGDALAHAQRHIGVDLNEARP